MPREHIEEPGLSAKEKVARLVAGMGPLENTIQYSWFIEMAQALLGFKDDRLTMQNWEALFDTAQQRMAKPDWFSNVMRESKLEAVFLTNDFDDALTGFDTNVFIPCLRTDDLVFHLAKPSVQERLQRASGVTVKNAASLQDAIGRLFAHFAKKGCRACAVSLPPDFSPSKVSATAADHAVQAAIEPAATISALHQRDLSNFVFWTLAEFCVEYRLPFDLMIGVNRAVYPGGVYQGQDLYDSRVSLIQYRELFNAFPQVTFPISVLASVTNQELTSYAWIFPNVVTNGHWWYSNTPTFIEHDAACRLGSGAAHQANRLLQRYVQAGICPAEVPHVQAHSGEDSGRTLRDRPRLVRGPGCRFRPRSAARQRGTNFLRKELIVHRESQRCGAAFRCRNVGI